MAARKDNLPLTMDNDMEQTSSITYATEVIAIIAGVAANEVEGIAGMCNISSGILGKNRNITKGVKVEVGTEEVSCDLYVIIEYGQPIQKVAMDAQESVRKAIESMTGMRVVRVDVHVQGVSFEKENSALTAGQQKAALFSGTKEEAVKAEPVKAEEPKAEEPAEEPAPAPAEEPAVENATEIVESVLEEVTEAAAEAAAEEAAAEIEPEKTENE